MNREEVRETIRRARTLEACEAAEKALAAYLKTHPDDFDLVMEGDGLRMMKTALQEVASSASSVSVTL